MHSSGKRLQAGFIVVAMVFAPLTTSLEQNASTKELAGSLILVGEIHGTKEMPRLFGNLAKVTTAATNKPVAVGFELPIALQPLIDDAIRHHAAADVIREQIVGRPSWQAIHDGRSSEAMLDLICEMVDLAQKSRLSMFFFDTQESPRDDALGRRISTQVREGHYEVTLILIGNVHANTAPQHPKIPAIHPTGWRLTQEGFKVRSFEVGHSGGEAWLCTPECGVHQLKPYATSQEAGYDGLFNVGPISASRPARASKETTPSGKN